MQHRYKINNSAQGKKSVSKVNQTYKNDTLSYINQLDKCTQILRQDRIWIRNQLKANDEEIFKIFKEAKRPLSICLVNTDLQHLQIKLRKHIASVKSKAKLEQLTKFKENMHLGDWSHQKEEKEPQHKRQTMPKYQLLPTNIQISETKGLKPKMTNVTEKQSSKIGIYPYRNGSANSKKNGDTYPAPMEQITERDSENMTSARQRVFVDEFNGDGFGLSHSYNQWKRPDQPTVGGLSSHYVADPFKPKLNQSSHFNNLKGKEQIKVKPIVTEQPLNRLSNNFFENDRSYLGNVENLRRNTNSENQSAEHGKKPNKLDMETKQQKQNICDFKDNHQKKSSINRSLQHTVDKGKNKSDENSPKIEIKSARSQQSNNLQDTLKLSMKGCDLKPKVEQQNEKQMYHHKNYSDSNNNIRQSTAQDASKCNSNTVNNVAGNGESLFTSPELLAECRNFLKLKSNAKPSTEKEQSINRYAPDYETHFSPLKFDYTEAKSLIVKDEHNYNSNSSNSMMSIFNDVQCGTLASPKTQQSHFLSKKNNNFEQNVKIQNQVIQTHIQKQRQEIIVNPNIQPQPTTNFDNSSTFQYFHTFSGLSSQKKQMPPPQLATAQEFVELVMDAVTNEPEGFVYWDTLQKLTQMKCPQFSDSFQQCLYPTDDEDKLVLISNVGRVLQGELSDGQQQRQETENEVRSIYRLLDIEQKGYVSEHDVDDFLSQLEDSEAKDIEVISQYIWRLFQSIDRDTEQTEGKQIDYWGMFSRKHSNEFRQLYQILQQFEFQIE